jgi:hypothetical protein
MRRHLRYFSIIWERQLKLWYGYRVPAVLAIVLLCDISDQHQFHVAPAPGNKTDATHGVFANIEQVSKSITKEVANFSKSGYKRTFSRKRF